MAATEQHQNPKLVCVMAIYGPVLSCAATYIMIYKVVLTFSVDEIVMPDLSNDSYSAVLSRGVVYYAVQSGSSFRVCR